jgi:hypothetical protein
LQLATHRNRKKFSNEVIEITRRRTFSDYFDSRYPLSIPLSPEIFDHFYEVKRESNGSAVRMNIL